MEMIYCKAMEPATAVELVITKGAVKSTQVKLSPRLDFANLTPPVDCTKHSREKSSLIRTTATQTKKSSLLTLFLRNLSETSASYPDGPEASYIISFMSGLSEKVCERLQTYHKMFKDCHLLKTGSIYEGLKVPTLPLLTQPKYAVFEPDTSFEYLKWHFVKSKSEEDDDWLDALIHIDGFLKETIKDLLPEKWHLSLITGGKISAGYNIAHTLQVCFDGVKYSRLMIDVDFCFAVPLKKFPRWVPGLAAQDAVMTDIDDGTIHYILRNEMCRMSFSFNEQTIVNRYEIQSKPKEMLRLLKVLRSKYLSKTFDTNSRGMSSSVSTYWLKTLLYEVLQSDPCAKCWGDFDMEELLTGQLEKLHACIEHGTLYSFFIPKYNLLGSLSGLKHRRYADTAFRYEPFSSQEKIDCLLKELQELISNLKLLQSDHEEGFKELQEIEMRVKRDSERDFETGMKAELLTMLFYYAYNNADDEQGLQTMRGFVNAFLPCMEMVGEGSQLVLKERGKIVNIDQWLTEVYTEDDDGNPFNYFPFSR